MAIKPVGYRTYGGSTTRPTPFVLPKPRPAPGADYLTYGGNTTQPGSYVRPSGGMTTPVTLGYTPPPGGGGGGTRTTTTTSPLQVYEGDILNDPRSIGAQGTYDATVQQLQNTRRAQFRQALISSGYDPGALPSDIADYTGDIDQATRDAAAANQLSGRAQLNKALNQAQTDLPYELARRGVARSGALPVGQTSLQEQYQTQAQQGLGDLLQTLRGYGSDYASGFNQAGMGLNAAREAVAQRLAQQKGYSQTVTTEDLGGGDYGGGELPGYGDGGGPQRADAFQQLQDFVSGLSGVPKTPGRFQGSANLNAIAKRITQGRKVRAG